jgi:hypothetical protein
MRRLVLLGAMGLLVTACGHAARSSTPPPPLPGSTSATTVTTTQTTPPAQEKANVRVYFLRDGKVAPVSRTVSAPAVATGALAQLRAGPTTSEKARGFTSAAQNAPTALLIEAGVASIDAADLTHAGLAQIVYTLTQFPTIHGVHTSRMIGDAKPLTRADFEDVTPAILVESPLPDESVTSPLRVSGTANTFEATFDLELRDANGNVLVHKFATATSGSGQRGTFATTLTFSGTPTLLVAWEPSAENGQPLHEVQIPLR